MNLHIVCPSCSSINRIVEAKLADRPKCGKCKQPLFNGSALELDSNAFLRHLDKNDIPLIVDFWASWCGPCKMMAPAFAAAAIELEPQYRLIKVNTEQNQTLGSQFNIQSIPTMLALRGGKEIARTSGAMSTADIVRWVQSNL